MQVKNPAVGFSLWKDPEQPPGVWDGGEGRCVSGGDGCGRKACRLACCLLLIRTLFSHLDLENTRSLSLK